MNCDVSATEAAPPGAPLGEPVEIGRRTPPSEIGLIETFVAPGIANMPSFGQTSE
jgi:hypothetical protein